MLYIPIQPEGTDDYVEITSLSTIIDNYYIVEFNQLDSTKIPFCLYFKVDKKSPYLKNVSKKIEHEFVELEQHEYFDYYFPFDDIEKGTSKCVEILSSVFGITKLEQVDIKTEALDRIYSTAKLPRPKPQRKQNTERQSQIKTPRKTSMSERINRAGQFFSCSMIICLLCVLAFLSALEFIYYPVKTHMGRYILQDDGSMDISNFTEWSKTSEKYDTLPQERAIYMWCMEEGASLPHKIMREDPPFRTVTYKGKTYKVLFIGCTDNLYDSIMGELVGEPDNDLHNYMASLLGISKVYENSKATIPEEKNTHVISYMYYNLQLFYWKYYSSMWRSQYNENEEVKDMIEILHPPLNIYEAYSFKELYDFRALMIATSKRVSLKEAVMKYYEEKHRRQTHSH